MTTLATLLNRGNADLIYLVEFNVLKLADGSLMPLYFSNKPFYASDKQFLPCISSLSDLDRAANDTMDPAYLPTWGDISFLITGTYKPDAGNSIPWNLLLYKDTYTFAGQSLMIKIGAAGDAYTDFTTIFSGQIGEVSWNDTELTFTIYDKAQELETKYPDYELPESEQVDEDSWDQAAAILLGQVKNFTPVLIKSGLTGSYNHKYALACHVIDSLVAVYFDQSDQSPPTTPGQYLFTKTDVSPVKHDTIYGGSVKANAYGPYTGSLLRAKWVIQIDSITALNSQGSSGPEVGLATFRWKLEGDTAWRGEGILTWLLAYDSTTLVKNPAAGAAAMAVIGDYTGDCKLSYKVKVVRAGDIGDAISPQFIWSDDNGATWQPADVSWWDPVNSNPAPGEMSVVAYNPGDSVLVEITTGGNVGGAVRFKWSNDGGATYTTGVQIPDTNPIELFTGYSIQFTAPGEVGIDDYDAGDEGGSTSAIDIVDTDLDGTSDPVLLNRGLSVEFSGVGVTTSTWTWTLVGIGTGVCSVSGIPTGKTQFNVTVVEITSAGGLGVAEFKWETDDPVESGTGVIVAASVVLGTSGFTLDFTDGTYEVGDKVVISSYYTPAFVVDDVWTFSFKEIPIPLADGVSIQFVTQTGQDFYLWDEFSFILMSTISVNFAESTDLTVDVKGLINPATDLFADTIGQMIYSLLRIFPEWADAVIDLPSITAFDVAIPYAAGLAIDSPDSITSIITQLLTGIPAIFSITNAGKFYLQELVVPVGPPALVVTDEHIMDLPNFIQLPGITKRVYLEYDKNYTTNSGWSLTNVSQARMAWLKRGNRQISRKDDSVLTNYPAASDIGPLETALIDRDDAGLLAAKLLALYQLPHETMTIEIGLQAAQLDIGDIVEVRRDKFGQDAGQLYKVLGTNINFTDRLSELTLWR